MGTPITIVVNAQTAEAAKELAAFVAETQNGLKKIEAEAAKVKEALRLSPQDFNGGASGSFGAGRGVGNWFNAAEITSAARTAGQGLQTLTHSAGNSRLAYMELGHVARATAEGLAAGISPQRMLAMELPRVAQSATLLGIGFGTLGAAALALTPLIITGGFAWAAYTAHLEEVRTRAELVQQTLDLIARNFDLLYKAKEAKLISDKDFANIKSLLDLKSATGLQAAVQEMKKLGISPQQMEAAEKFRNTLHQIKVEAFGHGFQADYQRALDEYERRIEELNDLAKKNPALNSQLEGAKALAKQDFDTKMESLRAVRDRAVETEQLKKLEAEMTEYELKNADKKIGKAEEEFQLKMRYYNLLHEQQVVGEDRYNELWNAAMLQRQQGVKAENELIEKSAQTRRELEVEATGPGLEREIAAINRRYDQEEQRLRELIELKRISEPDAESLESGLILAQSQEIEQARTKSLKAESDKRLKVEQDYLESTSSLLGSAAQMAKMFGREGFIAWKAIAIAQAVVSGANAVLLQLGAGDPYSAPFRAAAAAAVAAVQIATIVATQPSGYREGGYTGDGDAGATAGVVHKREFVVNARRTAQFRPLLEAIHTGRLPSIDSPSLMSVPGSVTGDAGATQSPRHVAIGFIDDRQSFKRFLESNLGREIILRHIQGGRTDIGLET
jgi:hypothetical protein